MNTNKTQNIADCMIGKYCVIRTYSAGIHAGILKSTQDKKAILSDSRRIWYWAGAASISQLAKSGTSSPSLCKFSVSVDEILLTECIEIIPCTAASERVIREIPEWTS